MGVLRVSSSCLMKSAKPGIGLRAERAESSEGKVEGGKVEVMGVLSCNVGLVVVGAMLEEDREIKRMARWASRSG